MDKILELLNISALDESDQKMLSEKLNVLVEAKANERLQSILEEEKQKLVSEFEEKFEQFTDNALSNFSDFVDTILEEEMEIPANILEYARKGEIYEGAIEALKRSIAIDEGVLDEEVNDLLSEARDEIVSLREQLDESIAENIEAKDLLKEAQIEFHKIEICSDLSESHRETAMQLLEGIGSIEDVDSKFEVIVEALKELEDDDEDDDDKSKDKDSKKKEEKEDDDDDEMKESANGKGSSEVQSLNEDVNKNIFSQFINNSKSFLRQ